MKNAEGVDSPRTCRDDQSPPVRALAQAAGIDLKTDETGLPPFAFEVSPLFADTATRFKKAWKSLPHQPP